MKIIPIVIGLFGTLTLGAYSADPSPKTSSLARMSTITCLKKTADSWRQAVLVIYEPFPVSCAEEFKPHTVVLTGTFRPIPLDKDGIPEEGAQQTPELPMIQYLGQLKRTTQGGFQFSSGGQNAFEVSLETPESQTRASGNAMHSFEGFSNCTIAPFKNFCGMGTNR